MNMPLGSLEEQVNLGEAQIAPPAAVRTLITIVSPCYNESENIEELYQRLCSVTDALTRYRFEFLFIDNASTDDTAELLRAMAGRDPRVRVIINTRNFGHIRSPYWGILQSRGAATIYLASDLQDPPEVIPQFIEQWEHGWKVVLAVKPVSQTSRVTHNLRRFYYHVLDGISDIDLVRDATGFGLYEHVVLEHLRTINDPYPFLRGLICELGFPVKTLKFTQPRRARGISKNNFYTLYDIAMLGIVSHSLVPLRLAGMLGMLIGLVSVCIGIFYTVLKLLYWDTFPIGVAPLIIGIFFLFGMLFVFIGLLGEYVGSIHTYVKNRPIVVERERINFDQPNPP